MLAALGQRDVEAGGGLPGVVEEQLVEITHAVKQERIRVCFLDLKELRHHRCRFAASHASHIIRFSA